MSVLARQLVAALAEGVGCAAIAYVACGWFARRLEREPLWQPRYRQIMHRIAVGLAWAGFVVGFVGLLLVQRATAS